MPKRRLPNSGIQTDRNSSLQQPKSRSSSRKKISEVFTKFADAFNKHAEYHKITKNFVRPDEEEAKLPERCRKDLGSARVLLPKLEKCFPSQQAEHCDASDLAHLCDFYERVLRGVYCPHSPGLFQWGRDPKGSKCYCDLCLFGGVGMGVSTYVSHFLQIFIYDLFSSNDPGALATVPLNLPFCSCQCERFTSQGSNTCGRVNCQYDRPFAQLFGK